MIQITDWWITTLPEPAGCIVFSIVTKLLRIAPANVDRLIFDRLQKFDGSRILIGVFRIKTHLDEAMLSVVFWNLQKRPRSEIVGRMARERAADLVILTECDEDDDLMLQSLRDATGKQFRNVDDLSEKVRIFSSLPISMVRPHSNSLCGRISIQRIILAKTEFLLVAVHLVSKLNRTDSDQLQDAIELSTQIKNAEKYFNH